MAAGTGRAERFRAKAVQALLEAGEGARARSSLEQALRYAERAQTLASDERERLRALMLTAHAHHAAARPDDALAAYLAAINTCRTLGDREAETLARAWAVLMNVRYYGAHSTRAQERAIELIQQAANEDDGHDSSFAHAARLIARWGLRALVGEDPRTLAEARHDAEHAVAIAEAIGPPELLANALECLTWTVLEEGLCESSEIGERLIRVGGSSADRFEAHECLVTAAMCLLWSGDFERSTQVSHDAAARAARLSPHRELHAAAAQTLCLAPPGRFAELGEATRRVVEIVRDEGEHTCNQGLVSLAGRALWLFEKLHEDVENEALALFESLPPVSRPLGVKSEAAACEMLRPLIGTERTRARLAHLEPGGDKATGILTLRAWLPVLALGAQPPTELSATIDRARELAREACAPALGWIADWAAAVALAAEDPAAALTRGRRATTALARYGERYTAALLMCDLLPLVKDANGIAAIADQTADQLETMGARASATRARAAVTPG